MKDKHETDKYEPCLGGCGTQMNVSYLPENVWCEVCAVNEIESLREKTAALAKERDEMALVIEKMLKAFTQIDDNKRCCDDSKYGEITGMHPWEWPDLVEIFALSKDDTAKSALANRDAALVERIAKHFEDRPDYEWGGYSVASVIRQVVEAANAGEEKG